MSVIEADEVVEIPVAEFQKLRDMVAELSAGAERLQAGQERQTATTVQLLTAISPELGNLFVTMLADAKANLAAQPGAA